MLPAVHQADKNQRCERSKQTPWIDKPATQELCVGCGVGARGRPRVPGPSWATSFGCGGSMTTTVVEVVRWEAIWRSMRSNLVLVPVQGV